MCIRFTFYLNTVNFTKKVIIPQGAVENYEEGVEFLVFIFSIETLRGKVHVFFYIFV